MSDNKNEDTRVVIPLAREEIVAGKRERRRELRVETVTTRREECVVIPLRRQRVEISRVPIDRFVDCFPPVREENGVTVVPLVDEVPVVTRRLLLREEVHIRHLTDITEHREAIELQGQDARIIRDGREENDMTAETIVAIYDNLAAAEAACAELTAAGVGEHEISWTHNGPTAAPRHTGFWSRLFGGEPDHDTTVYDRSVESGAQVLTVNAPAGSVERIAAILEKHDPIDIEERATGYGVGRENDRNGVYGAGEGRDEVLPLSEESLSVGKRLLDRGTTRVRRFVVETPVEREVALHREHVTVERRPASGTVRGDSAFTDRVVTMTETDEEAVVGKTAHVAEEVVVRRTGADRVETVHDTLRREDVDITHGAARGTD